MNLWPEPTSRSYVRALLACLVLVSLVGCTRTLPRQTVPQAVAPDVAQSAPPPAGTGRLVVDVPGASVPVTQMTLQAQPRGERFTLHEEPTVVCPATPCVLDLPIGNVALAFPVRGRETELSTPELVHVGSTPSVFRRSLDLYVNDRRGMYITGAITTVLGVLGVIVGLAVYRGADEGPAGNEQRLGGVLTMAGGGVLVIPGYLMVRFGAPTRTPGASVHFPL